MNKTTTLKIKPTQIESFKEIDKVFNYGHYSWLESNKQCSETILSKPIGEEEDIVLYYEGENQKIPGGKEIYSYFADKGYEVLPNAHASYLVNAMKELSEEKLTGIGIPSYVDIVLPTDEASLLPYEYGDLCFLEARRNGGERKLLMHYFDCEWRKYFAFLLRKKDSKTLSPETLSPSETLTLKSAENLAIDFCEKWVDGKARAVVELRDMIMKLK